MGRIIKPNSDDKKVVKLGKKEYVGTSKIDWGAGDNETLIHMDFRKPQTKLMFTVKQTPREWPAACAKYHSARLTFNPKTKKLHCTRCGRVPK